MDLACLSKSRWHALRTCWLGGLEILDLFFWKQFGGELSKNNHASGVAVLSDEEEVKEVNNRS